MATLSTANYLKEIDKILAIGNATEHTYRPALKTLIETIGKGISATNEPKREKCGAPDYIITRGHTPLGYIEAKDIGNHLDQTERSEQIKRYLDGLNNLILTDYLEFRWFEDGEHRMSARLARVGADGKLRIEKGGAENFAELMTQFLASNIPTVTSSKNLAGRMAALARLIRDLIMNAFEHEDRGGTLHGQYEGFKKVLLHDLEAPQFADMYAQTICYGLFAARCNHQGPEPFAREKAAFELPETNPFLIEMFGHIAGPSLDKRVTWAVDHLAELLWRADMSKILQDFGKRTRKQDPIVHFYETFLAEYDPRMRESRGVYYTPEPVVDYIVRSVDHILKTEFKLPEGLADTTKIKTTKVVHKKDGKPTRKQTGESHKVLILDPAVGTGTFLHRVIDYIYDHISEKGMQGMWPGYVSQHLLPRLFGFELLMAPYAVAHMKLGLQLAETGYDFKSGERLRVYLTNTLEEAHEFGSLPLFADIIAKEANAAGQVKSEAPVMVVLGNPPYSGHSANTGEWISKLLRGKDIFTNTATANYFEVDGKPLGERNPKYLNDDYVKFIRFSQRRIEQTGYGVLAFISNHGYLDNPTFRGMRQSLMKTFDDIYLLDLHGNYKKKETCPDGTKDENVFDIQQGVAIGIFVKRPGSSVKKHTVKHAHLWGVRNVTEKQTDGSVSLTGGKYRWLYDKDAATTKWTTLEPQAPFYLFVPQDTRLLAEYEQGWKVTDAMPVYVNGFKTHRDHFAIDFDEDALHKRIAEMRDDIITDQEYANKHNLKVSGGWDLAEARQNLRNDSEWETKLIDCLYRPFDIRSCYFGKTVMDRPRRELIDHVAGKDNLCIGIGRQGLAVNDPEWALLSVSKVPIDTNTYRRGGVKVFPLYKYSKSEQDDFYTTDDEQSDMAVGRCPNLAPEFVEDISRRLKLTFVPDGMGDLKETFGPEDIFHYMYAVFHSPSYRERYAEFLKIDFPRLPLTSKRPLFRKLCTLGEELVGLHLMEQNAPVKTKYPVTGDNTVDKVRYTEPGSGAPTGRVWINTTQYFENVPEEVWQFHIGGYQVCQKWLKDRKGRMLSYDDLTHYQHIVSALTATIKLMTNIDTTINTHGGWPDAFE
jgi:predicted helicase